MIEFLATQVLMGNVTIEQIPDRFRASVRQKLEEIGGGDVIDQT